MNHRGRQYSLRTLLIVTALVAAGAAFAARYPLLAACIVFTGVPYLILEFGFRWAVDERRPLLTGTAWMSMGVLLGAMFFLFVKQIIQAGPDRDPGMMAVIMLFLVLSVLSLGFGIKAFRAFLGQDKTASELPEPRSDESGGQ